MTEEEKQYENILCEFFNRTHNRMPKPTEFNLIGELAKKYSNPVEAEVKPANGGCMYCGRPVSKDSISGKSCDKCLDDMIKRETKYRNQ